MLSLNTLFDYLKILIKFKYFKGSIVDLEMICLGEVNIMWIYLIYTHKIWKMFGNTHTYMCDKIYIFRIELV